MDFFTGINKSRRDVSTSDGYIIIQLYNNYPVGGTVHTVIISFKVFLYLSLSPTYHNLSLTFTEYFHFINIMCRKILFHRTLPCIVKYMWVLKCALNQKNKSQINVTSIWILNCTSISQQLHFVTVGTYEPLNNSLLTESVLMSLTL